MSIVDADSPLDPEERATIAALADHAPTPRAASVDALRYIQSRRRYVADGVLDDLATLLGVTSVELDEVATFHNLIFRRPVGDHVILLCDSVACWMMGRDRLAARITAQLGIRQGQTTADGAVTLLPIVCLGHCDHAPALMVGDRLHGDVDELGLGSLLRSLTGEQS